MKKALVIQLARFGDLLQTKRLALSLCRDFETHLCVDWSLEPLARLVFPASAGFVVHAVHAHGQADAAAVLAVNAAVFTKLAALKFDVLYNCNSSGMNTALAALFDPHTVRGLRCDAGQALRETWMRLAFRWTSERRIAPMNLVDYWALFAPNPIAPGLVNPPAQGGGKGLGLVLAGRMARRSLPPAVLAPIVKVLAATLPGHKNAPVYLLGAATERPLARELAHALPASVKLHDLTGSTDWPGLIGALTDLDAVLSPDTGTMHLAAHLGVPVRAFFLSSAWLWETGPYGLGHTVYQAVQPCLPCVESQPCPHDTACLVPFASPAFLRLLARDCDDGLVDGAGGIMRLRAEQDALGQCWRGGLPGQDAYARSRSAWRAVAAEFQHINLHGGIAVSDGSAPANSALVDGAALYHESDWMLPPLPGTGPFDRENS